MPLPPRTAPGGGQAWPRAPRYPSTHESRITGLRRDFEWLKKRGDGPPWITIGTSGVDGAAAPDGGTAYELALTQNPYPYRPADLGTTIAAPFDGPPPFTSPWTNGFSLLPNGDVAGPLQIRWTYKLGLEIRGQPLGGTDNSVIVSLGALPAGWIPPLDHAVGPFIGSDVTATSAFTMWLAANGDLYYGTSI